MNIDYNWKRIRRKVGLGVAFCVVASCSSQTALALQVLACEPAWASLAKEIGGKVAKVTSATSATQDAHHVESRPALIAAARSADLLICTGFGVERGWLPVLLSSSANPNIQKGKPGYFEVAQYVLRERTPVSLQYEQANLRQRESYHVYSDPHNVSVIAEALVKRFADIDPANANYYLLQYNSFSENWNKAIRRWETEATSLKGVPIVQQHNAWTYLCNWLGMRVVATLEPQHGQGATSKHLDSILAALQVTPATMVLSAPYEDSRDAKRLAERAKLPFVELPVTVGSNKEARDLFSLFDDVIRRLRLAAKANNENEHSN